MRTANDLCLLCKSNAADKTNSHVIPSFITKGLLMTGERARGYTFSTDSVDKKSKPVQSSDKEDFILCSDCESYFGVLETVFCNKLNNPILDIRKQDQFEWIDEPEQKIALLINYNGLALRLFLTSILWRSAVCNTHTVHRFTLQEATVEAMRICLMEFRSQGIREFNDTIEGKQQTFPFNFDLTTIIERGHTNGKLVFLHPNADEEGFMVLNDYILTYQFHPNDGKAKLIQTLNSGDSNQVIKLKVSRIEAWNQIIDELKVKFAEKAKAYLDREGKTYVPMVK
ncbi:hypothetical protein [Pedobacter sp. SG918]|uniref:hypothetical protein n=1 Tax=Pedobacter sp. SG918 TaxID=2587136 RepID=UPI00146BD794|nr:hypothetical protein [Pedobacter sp. SG918]NMN37726.1 hypothetical protein [Pedobacter sp. SG918]